MDSTANPFQRQFLEEIATQYGFTGDTRTVFLSRFDEVNAGKINKVLARYIEWNTDCEDKAQKLQDELDTICQVLEQKGCTIKRVSTDVKKRGRAPKGQSPWEQAFKWLWDEKFPQWQQRHDQNNAVPSEQSQKNAVCGFLEDIEDRFKYIRLLHIREQRIVLQDQYIPIQVTLERKYKHEIETIFSYAESEGELKRVYALKHQEDSQPTQVDWAEAKQQHQRIMVLADPGMGKSTLLKMEAGLTAESERKCLESNGKNVEDAILPLFLRLSDLVDEKQADIFSAEIIDAIPLILGKEYCKTLQDNLETAAVIGQVLNEKLRTGKCLLLLDALDEVPQKHRSYLSEKLNRFVRNYPGSIICTSRIVGYGGGFLDGAKEVEIVPFSQKQTEEYIEIWFKNAAGYLNDDSVSALALIRELQNKPQIRGLAQNPLLLSLICSLYQEKGLTLPARRCQVYEQAVRCMLSKWRKKRNPELNDAWVDAKTELLEELAYQFSVDNQEIFTLRELRKKIDKHLRSDDVSSDFQDKNAAQLIEELSEQDGILQKLHQDDKQYLFLHRTFQEYLTACYLNRTKDGIDRAKAHFWEYEWHETLSLMAGLMKNPIPLLETIRNEKDDIFQTQLLLAGHCIAECNDISHPLIGEIIDRIYQFWCRYADAEFINSVVVTLGQTNIQMVGRLGEALNHEDEYVRWNAADALNKIGNPQAVPALIAAFNHKDKYVVWNAAVTLGNIGNLQAVDALMTALKDEDEDLRSMAAAALGNIDNLQVMDVLMAALNDEYWNVRSNAAEALGKIGNPQAVPALMAALKDENKDVRSNAAEALGKIGNPQAVDALISALNNEDKDENVRWMAAAVLGNTGNPQAVDALISALNDEDEDENVRWMAATVLGNIGNPQAMDALISASKGEDWDVRRKAAETSIGNPQTVDDFLAALKHQDWQVRSNAAEALGKIDSSEILAKLIQNPEIDIYDSYIFVSARKLAVRFRKEGVPFIPVYPELLNREADTDA